MSFMKIFNGSSLAAHSTQKSNRYFKMVKSIREIRNSVRQLNPDVAVGFMHSMYLPLGASLLGTSIPVVASEHIVPEHYKSRPIQWAALNFTPFLVEKITCVSQQVKEAFGSFLNRKMVVVLNPVFLEGDDKADPSGHNKERKTLLTVGRLDKQKDQKVLINAFSQLALDFPDWDLKIIGEGDLRPQLEQQIKDLQMSNRVFLTRANERDLKRICERAFIRTTFKI